MTLLPEATSTYIYTQNSRSVARRAIMMRLLSNFVAVGTPNKFYPISPSYRTQAFHYCKQHNELIRESQLCNAIRSGLQRSSFTRRFQWKYGSGQTMYLIYSTKRPTPRESTLLICYKSMHSQQPTHAYRKLTRNYGSLLRAVTWWYTNRLTLFMCAKI